MTGQAGLLRFFMQGLAALVAVLGTLIAALVHAIGSVAQVTPPRVWPLIAGFVLVLVVIDHLGPWAPILLASMVVAAMAALTLHVVRSAGRR